MVTNLALWCSPDQVEFTWWTCKKGVEFKSLRHKQAPARAGRGHSRAIASSASACSSAWTRNCAGAETFPETGRAKPGGLSQSLLRTHAAHPCLSTSSRNILSRTTASAQEANVLLDAGRGVRGPAALRRPGDPEQGRPDLAASERCTVASEIARNPAAGGEGRRDRERQGADRRPARPGRRGRGPTWRAARRITTSRASTTTRISTPSSSTCRSSIAAGNWSTAW